MEAWLPLTFYTPWAELGEEGTATQKGLRNDPACLSYLLFLTKGPEARAASGGQRKGPEIMSGLATAALFRETREGRRQNLPDNKEVTNKE